MKAKKISALVAVILGAGMILCGSASAGDNQTLEIYFECQAKGKGYDYSTDNASAEEPTLSESKGKLPKQITFYLRVDRIGGEVEVVYYDADNKTWESDGGGEVMKTDTGLLVGFESTIHNSEDNTLVDTFGYSRVQLKEKDGELKSAKFQSIGGLYMANDEPETEEGSASIGFGSPKLKGKLIAFGDLPKKVREVFEPPAPEVE